MSDIEKQIQQFKVDPIKLCCGKKMSEHNGPTCPDGMTPCCMCFGRFARENLYVDDNGDIWDICVRCGINDAMAKFRRTVIDGQGRANSTT